MEIQSKSIEKQMKTIQEEFSTEKAQKRDTQKYDYLSRIEKGKQII